VVGDFGFKLIVSLLDTAAVPRRVSRGFVLSAIRVRVEGDVRGVVRSAPFFSPCYLLTGVSVWC